MVKDQIPEEMLVSLLVKKDKKAIEYLYDRYCAALYGVILRILKADDIAEEVLQDCFMKFWNKISEYDANKGKLFTWMLNIARNQAIDKMRSKDFKSMARSEELNSSSPVAGRNTSSKFEPEHIGVKDMLEKLHPDQKFLLDLVYFKGYSQSEISDEFKIPLGTVKTRVRAALMVLRKLFERN